MTTSKPASSNKLAETSNQMKAVLVSKFGNPNDVMTVGDTTKPEREETKLQIRVHACSLSPGDYRALLGDKTVVANPKAWPYIPGGDVCGTIEYVPIKFQTEFNEGDIVVATWDIWGEGGMAEYANVLPSKTVKLPSNLTAIEGAALANSASHALKAVALAKIKEGDRVLVIGASGGVGTLAVQLAKKKYKASYVGAVTTDEALMKQLGVVDKTVNYEQTPNWWEVKEWKSTQFDVALDLALGLKGWNKVRSGTSILKGAKKGGRWVAVVYKEWHIHIERFVGIFGLLLPFIARQLANPGRRRSPKYFMYLDSPTQDSLTEGLSMAANKELETILDPNSPHSFTTESVRDAWNIHIARKGHGKIVVQI